MERKTITALMVFLLWAIMLASGCARQNGFDQGLDRLESINSMYNVTMDGFPKSLDVIENMLKDYKEAMSTKLENEQEQFEYLSKYRILDIEAERLMMLGDKYGEAGRTRSGFGCKSRPLIIESVSLRNESVSKGYEASGLLEIFINKYKNYADTAGLSMKNVIFRNATFYQVAIDARKDSNTINSLCPWNVTLELYHEEFAKSTNLTKEQISSMDYKHSVELWKKSRGIG